jgi:hypothetical protein
MRCFRKRGTFFKAQLGQGEAVPPVAPDHRLVWLPVADVSSRLSHESHAGALGALNAEPGAAPNGGPATRLSSSAVTEGPPSVS